MAITECPKDWPQCECCKHPVGPLVVENCSICGIQVGQCCGQQRGIGGQRWTDGTSQILSGSIWVCPECKEAGDDVSEISFYESMKKETDTADQAVTAIVEQWKFWAKKRKEMIAEGSYVPKAK